MTSHSNTLSSTGPHDMPWTSLACCICLSCRLSRPAAAEDEVAMVGRAEEGGGGDGGERGAESQKQLYST